MSRTSLKPLRITYCLFGFSIEISLQDPCSADREDPSDSTDARKDQPCAPREQG